MIPKTGGYLQAALESSGENGLELDTSEPKTGNGKPVTVNRGGATEAVSDVATRRQISARGSPAEAGSPVAEFCCRVATRQTPVQRIVHSFFNDSNRRTRTVLEVPDVWTRDAL